MKKISIYLTIILSLCLLSSAHSICFIEGTPPETFSLRLPENLEKNWRDISWNVDKNSAIVEKVPVGQTVEDWTDLICIQYINFSAYEDTESYQSVDHMIDTLYTRSYRNYPSEINTWKLIEKSENEFIYETILHEEYNNVPMQHDISRLILTDYGTQRIAYTKKNSLMTPDERDMWIDILKNNAQLVPFEDFKKSDEISMVDQTRTSYTFSNHFMDWSYLHNMPFDNGFVISAYLPNEMIGVEYVTECLEVMTCPVLVEKTINDFFEAEKANVFSKGKTKVRLKVIKKKEKEIYFYYSYPKDHLRLNSVVRMVLTDKGYYSMHYKLGLDHDMHYDDIVKWAKILKTIEIEAAQPVAFQ